MNKLALKAAAKESIKFAGFMIAGLVILGGGFLGSIWGLKLLGVNENVSVSIIFVLFLLGMGFSDGYDREVKKLAKKNKKTKK